MAADSDIVLRTRARMQKSLESMMHEFMTVRTGKASPALLDIVRVEAYGQQMPLTQLATVSAPEPTQLVIQPWDRSTIGPIQKAIQASDLGFNPSNDGSVIRIIVPPPSEERRKEFVKLVHKMAEGGRVAVRNERRDSIEELRKAEKSGDLAEDESRRLQKLVQEITDEFVKKVDETLETKEAEIMEV